MTMKVRKDEFTQNHLAFSFILAIIQFSADSIHVVKSSDPRFAVSVSSINFRFYFFF